VAGQRQKQYNGFRRSGEAGYASHVYRLDHAVTANQKTILNAFGLDANHIKYYASELSKELKKAE
jgi:hypothetical protein